MSLLVRLMEDPLDPEYRRAAARRRAGAPRRRTPARLVVAVALLCIGLFTTVAVSQAREQPITSDQRERLVAQIKEQTARTDRLARQLVGLRQQVERMRAAKLAKSERGQRMRARLRRLEMAVGAKPVTGPGLVITLDDAPAGQDGISGADKPAGIRRVHDSDLRLLVNALWSAGADAIAVDGRRVTSLTAIRAAGEAILVNYSPITPPYTVTAIGDPSKLRSGLAASDAGRYFHTLQANVGISFDTKEQDGLRLPGASGISLRHAREVDSE